MLKQHFEYLKEHFAICKKVFCVQASVCLFGFFFFQIEKVVPYLTDLNIKVPIRHLHNLLWRTKHFKVWLTFFEKKFVTHILQKTKPVE